MRLILPNKKDRPCSSVDGHVAIMSDALACGIKLFLHPFLGSYSEATTFVLFSYPPNSWTQIVGTWLLWQKMSPDYPMSHYVFHTLFKLNRYAKRDGETKEKVKDWYYLTARGTHSPVITGHPSSIKH
ncbi:Uncharacterized protein Adt_05867 [Abeliophyllum distichum]|uniref:Uncharacterized protein n=1 Tax=Abeliophyllum distichum TaxID=126358 RepID=A0ABD1V5A3_9LAMI